MTQALEHWIDAAGRFDTSARERLARIPYRYPNQAQHTEEYWARVIGGAVIVTKGPAIVGYVSNDSSESTISRFLNVLQDPTHRPTVVRIWFGTDWKISPEMVNGYAAVDWAEIQLGARPDVHSFAAPAVPRPKLTLVDSALLGGLEQSAATSGRSSESLK